MKRYVLMAGLAILIAGCGSKTPAGPTPLPTTIVFTAALSAANEVPPITNADSGGRGTGTFTLNLTRDAAGTITDATGTFVYSLTGFPNDTFIRLTHIHVGGPAVTGGVVIDTGLSVATGFTMANGTVTNQTFSNRAVGATLANQIIADPNGYYFNVHSNLNPSGAVRAQLVRQP
jgi:CHRD domain-containing protein